MMTTLLLSVLLMAGLFLMLYAAVAFIQDKRFFTSAPKAVHAAVRPRPERFPGAHALGWALEALAIAMMGGAVVLGGVDGVKRGYGLWQFFARFLVMLLLLKAFDILFFDWFLLCNSGFFPHYYPEVRPLLGPQVFGYNWKEHLVMILLCPVVALALAWVCMLFQA